MLLLIHVFLHHFLHILTLLLIISYHHRHHHHCDCHRHHIIRIVIFTKDFVIVIVTIAVTIDAFYYCAQPCLDQLEYITLDLFYSRRFPNTDSEASGFMLRSRLLSALECCFPTVTSSARIKADAHKKICFRQAGRQFGARIS